MGFIDNLIAWCKDEIQHMKKQVEWMESGRVQLRTMSPDTGWINTTANDTAILNLHERTKNNLFLNRTRKDSNFKRPHI
jgi:hypothetical protein